MRAVLLALLAAAQVPATDEGGAVETRTIPARSESGRLQVLAVESRDPVVIDGVLDDSAWRLASPVSGFIQAEPYEGQPATEDTEVRAAFDGKNLYIAALFHDRGRSGVVVNDIREDFPTGEQDSFEIILDTLYDQRNGFVFMTNPEGARADQQMANEGREVNASWDAVWFVRTSRSEEGWIAEFAIPFSALRFDLESSLRWGINFSRRIRRNNEIDFWSPVPRAYTLNRVSLAGDLVGIGSTRPGRDFRVKPYVAGSTVRPAGGESFSKDGTVGVDVKYGITRALTLDATVKSDFAQVEADEQQVNLTQFSQFFPEQREPENNFSVVRVRKNVFATSDIGAIAMSRQSADSSADYNRVYGLDSNIRLPGNVDWSTYYVKTKTPGFDEGQYAFRSTLNHEGNLFHVKTGYMSIGDQFRNELGYYRRTGVRKYMLDTGVRPRPVSFQERGVREIHPHVVWNVFTDHSGDMVAKAMHSGITFFFNNGGHSQIAVNPTYELLESPLRLHPDSPPIPPGGYSWTTYVWDFTSDPSRALSVAGGITLGGLWSGTQRTLDGTVAYKPSYKFRVSLKVQRTAAKLDVPVSEFVTTLWTTRANYSFATNAFLDSLIQYDAARQLFNANIRFNFTYRPLSDLFIVYNEQRYSTPENPVPTGRGLIVKFTRMFAF